MAKNNDCRKDTILLFFAFFFWPAAKQIESSWSNILSYRPFQDIWAFCQNPKYFVVENESLLVVALHQNLRLNDFNVSFVDKQRMCARIVRNDIYTTENRSFVCKIISLFCIYFAQTKRKRGHCHDFETPAFIYDQQNVFTQKSTKIEFLRRNKCFYKILFEVLNAMWTDLRKTIF